jgi:transcription antitermination factor NusG
MSTSKSAKSSAATTTTTSPPWRGKPGVRTGTPVKVRGGPFCGHLGFLEERKPNRLALVWIEVLGRPVPVEIEPYYLDVLN